MFVVLVLLNEKKTNILRSKIANLPQKGIREIKIKWHTKYCLPFKIIKHSHQFY